MTLEVVSYDYILFCHTMCDGEGYAILSRKRDFHQFPASGIFSKHIRVPMSLSLPPLAHRIEGTGMKAEKPQNFMRDKGVTVQEPLIDTLDTEGQGERGQRASSMSEGS
ncbi:hypothetical protein PM082_004339 [Marasmius tenuissimus]|nr:hypothetical protein PM082_004339 [Marasmius tenuissimus]